MRPRWKEIEQENPWLETQSFDYDADHEAVATLVIDKERLPSFVFLDKNGTEFLRLNGEIPKDELVETISKNRDR
jgi:thioredoxin-related protein